MEIRNFYAQDNHQKIVYFLYQLLKVEQWDKQNLGCLTFLSEAQAV